MALAGYKPLTLDFLAFGAVKKKKKSFPLMTFCHRGTKWSEGKALQSATMLTVVSANTDW